MVCTNTTVMGAITRESSGATGEFFASSWPPGRFTAGQARVEPWGRWWSKRHGDDIYTPNADDLGGRHDCKRSNVMASGHSVVADEVLIRVDPGIGDDTL
jgi:hypothetical protein